MTIHDRSIDVLHLASIDDADSRSLPALLARASGRAAVGESGVVRGAVAVVRRRGDVCKQLAADDFPEDRFHRVTQFGPFDPTLLWRLGRIVRRTRAQIVHAHDAKSHMLALLLQIRHRFRLVATALPWARETWRDRFSAGVDQKLLPGFDRIIAANEQVARQLCLLGCRRGQVEVIPGMVDTERYSRAAAANSPRTEWRLTPHTWVVGVYVDRTTGDDASWLHEALRFAQAEAGTLAVVFFSSGDSDDAPSHDDLVNRGFAGRVFTLKPEDVSPSAYAALDAFVHCSEIAATPLLEAVSMEAPVLATAPAVADQLVEDGVTGLLAPNRAPQTVGAALARLLNDSDAAAAMAARARMQVCERFRSESVIERLQRIYLRALAEA